MAKHAPVDHASSALPWLSTLNGSAEGLMRASQSCMKACLVWQQEFARFATSRLQRDSEFSQHLLASRSWSDAVKAQQDWAATTGQDYLDEATRLLQLAQSTGAELWNPGAGEESPEARRAAE